MTKSPLILLVGELPVPSRRRTLPITKGFTFPSSRRVRGGTLGHFWQMQCLPQSRASPGVQEPAGHSPKRVQPRWQADLRRELCRAGWQPRCAAASAVLPARSQRGGEGMRSGASLMLSGQKPCSPRKKNLFEPQEQICNFISTQPTTKLRGSQTL